ncbi:hypothetical protein QBC45DRAFT_427412 [Copromyces sp. CBS 386.78]|nr:hypothetical protein QBC45DRAFT_427412 [Copromyces sp. CBS 386.78]
MPLGIEGFAALVAIETSIPILFILSWLVWRWLVCARLTCSRGVAMCLTTMVNPFPDAAETNVTYVALEEVRN